MTPAMPPSRGTAYGQGMHSLGNSQDSYVCGKLCRQISHHPPVSFDRSCCSRSANCFCFSSFCVSSACGWQQTRTITVKDRGERHHTTLTTLGCNNAHLICTNHTSKGLTYAVLCKAV